MKPIRWITACCIGLATSYAGADNGYPPPTGPYGAPPVPSAQQGNWQTPQAPAGTQPQGGAYGYQPPAYGYGEPSYDQPPSDSGSKGFNPSNMMNNVKSPMNSMMNPMRNMFGSKNREPNYRNAPPPGQWGQGAPGYGYPQQAPGPQYGYPPQYDQYGAPGNQGGAYGYPDQPAYGYPDQPAYGYPDQPAYGYPDQPAYG
ncbi:MAG: hypothetical protein ABW162_01610, partial [Candidatus Sedimenticola sp. PURPLELP]